MRQLVEILPDLSNLKFLELQKLNVSDQGFQKLFQGLLALPNLRSLDISSNPLSYFTFDCLANYLPQSLNSLNLSNTRLTDKNAIALLDVMLNKKASLMRRVDLSRNMSLGYKFSAFALFQVKHSPNSTLQHLDLSYTGVSQLHYQEISRILTHR
jgi:Leucine-rich repeat (LRR) protein